MQVINELPKIPPRYPDSHKGTYGSVFVLAGSPGKTGAAYLTSKAALRAGAGIVTLGIPKSLNTIMEMKLTCCMTCPLPETSAGTLSDQNRDVVLKAAKQHDIIAMGPGLSTHEETRRLIFWLMQVLDKPMVLDADALNAIGRDWYALEWAEKEVVLTPHPGEMARLVGLGSAADVQKNRLKIAMNFAGERGVVLVLKGYKTIVTDSQRVYMNYTGNPGMATAGSGDVLTGIIAGFMAQRMQGFEASQLAVYLHGLAGDRAKARSGEVSLIATDILEALPKIIGRYAAGLISSTVEPKE